ncbi:uncharacterized protein LOC135843597 [Planococcus citri]|uniref:uncharacterized protein LOC135843597 n=1 Tax=Planococcus citri TaxID=170843 RepID=UPI0031F8E40D
MSKKCKIRFKVKKKVDALQQSLNAMVNEADIDSTIQSNIMTAITVEIKTVYEGMYTCEEKYVKLAAAKGEEIGQYRKKLGSFNETIMLVCAGRDLKYRLETFGMDVNVIAGTAIDRSPELRTALKNMRASVNRRKLELCTYVMNLYDLYMRYLPHTVAWPVDDKGDWEIEVKIAYRDLKKIPANQEPQNRVTTPSLQDLILTFQAAEDETAAVEVFKKQCASCYWSSIDTDFVDEHHGLKELAASLPESEKVRLTSDNALAGIDPTAKTLATNLLKSKTYFTMDSDGGKCYAGCVEVFFICERCGLP